MVPGLPGAGDIIQLWRVWLSCLRLDRHKAERINAASAGRALGIQLQRSGRASRDVRGGHIEGSSMAL